MSDYNRNDMFTMVDNLLGRVAALEGRLTKIECHECNHVERVDALRVELTEAKAAQERAESSERGMATQLGTARALVMLLEESERKLTTVVDRLRAELKAAREQAAQASRVAVSDEDVDSLMSALFEYGYINGDVSASRQCVREFLAALTARATPRACPDVRAVGYGASERGG